MRFDNRNRNSARQDIPEFEQSGGTKEMIQPCRKVKKDQKYKSQLENIGPFSLNIRIIVTLEWLIAYDLPALAGGNTEAT